MPVSFSATEQGVYPVRVLLSLTGLTVTGTADAVDLYREVGGVRYPVRGGSTDAVTDSSFVRVDAELPFGVPVTYVAVVDDTDEYTAGPVTYELDGGKVAITDAINALAAETVILAWDEKTYGRRSTVFRVGARNVVVSGPLGQFDGTIELFTETWSSRDNVLAVLAGATEGIVQIRQAGPYDGVDCYVKPTSVTERRFSQDGSDDRRVLVLEAVEVEAWADELEASGYTLQDIANTYDGLTLDDLSDDFLTLLGIALAEFPA